MPVTYEILGSTTLTATANTITFSSIPNTYDELILYASLRSNTNNANWSAIQLNSSGANFEAYYMRNLSNDRVSQEVTGNNFFFGMVPPNYAATTGWSFVKHRIPRYASSQRKAILGMSTTESNQATSSENQLFFVGGSWDNTSAITSVTIDHHTNVIAIGSSFYLYGVKN